jgi:hypothetical protein
MEDSIIVAKALTEVGAFGVRQDLGQDSPQWLTWVRGVSCFDDLSDAFDTAEIRADAQRKGKWARGHAQKTCYSSCL